jgi:hypothetical protein
MAFADVYMIRCLEMIDYINDYEEKRRSKEKKFSHE